MKGSTTVTYVRDATDRIVERRLNGTITARYGSTGSGDAPEFTMNASNAVAEVTYSLPGGPVVTTRPTGNVWSYLNIHGDVVATADQAGTKQAPTRQYDPYGNLITGDVPDNSSGELDYGWLGQHQRPLEHEAALQPVVEMGARQYSPLLGRFLEVDPVEGGCANNYTYVHGDPTNHSDIAGTADCKKIFKKIRRALWGDRYGGRGRSGMKGVVPRWLKQFFKFKSRDAGHRRQYEQDQRYLRKRLKEYDDNDCWNDDYMTGNRMKTVRLARSWAKKPYPYWSSARRVNLGPLHWTWYPVVS